MKKLFSLLKHLIPGESGLEQVMPAVRGQVVADAPLNKMTWLGVGGSAEILFTPADQDDLEFFLANQPNAPLTVIGGGSNLLIRDGGIPGIVVHLGKTFDSLKIDGDKIICGAGVKNMEIARAAMEAGLSGFEFLCGIPGTLGGSIRMNAGAHGRSTADIVEEVTAFDIIGKKMVLPRSEIPFDYRTNALPDNWIFTGAVLKGTPENKENIQKRMTEYRQIREKAQPIGARTAGSIFKNPIGVKAWQLIEKAGCRGLKQGGAMISEKHCNFFINTGKATAQDFETLGETVQQRVFETSGITLEWEVRRIGVKTKRFSSFGGR